MRVIFMGKNKPSVLKALQVLIDNHIEVVAVVAPQEPRLGVHVGQYAKELGIPLTTDRELYGLLLGEQPRDSVPFSLDHIDLVISFLFWKRIRKPLIELPRVGCINFHPAPLPHYRGWGAYNFGILNGETQWGVSAHFVDETFDTGDLIMVTRFDIDPERETALSLEQKSQLALLELLKAVITELICKGSLPRVPQSSGREYTKAEAESAKRIAASDTEETIRRKIRAFWYPPYSAAKVTVNGREYFVIDEFLMDQIGEIVHSGVQR